MNVICIEEAAFYELIETVVRRLEEKLLSEQKEIWISAEEVKKLLHIRGKTTLQRYRDNGLIRYSQYGRTIVYDKVSVLEYLEKHACEVFARF